MNFERVIQNIIIVGLFIVAVHMLLAKKILAVSEEEQFAQGERIPSGQTEYVQEQQEQDLKNYIFNEASANDTLDKSFVFTSNVLQTTDPNLQRYDTTFRPQPVNNNQELQSRIQQRKSGVPLTTYQSAGDNMVVYDYPDKEQTDLTGGKFAGVLSPYSESETKDFSPLF